MGLDDLRRNLQSKKPGFITFGNYNVPVPELARTWDCNRDILVLNLQSPLMMEDVVAKIGYKSGVNTVNGYIFEYIHSGYHSDGTSDVDPFYIDVRILDGEGNIYVIAHNAKVWRSHYTNKLKGFLVFEYGTDVFIVDTRGEIFKLPSFSAPVHVIYNDDRNGCLKIGNLSLRYKTVIENKAFSALTAGTVGAQINPLFRKIFDGKVDGLNYLYFVVRPNKCGSILKYFMSQGMPYEVLPNLFEDDDTLNIRIPLLPDVMARSDVQFLYEKYWTSGSSVTDATYSVFDVPIEWIAVISTYNGYKLPRDAMITGMRCPEEYKLAAYSILNTLRMVFGTDDDGAAINQILIPVGRKLVYNRAHTYISTEFSEGMLPYSKSKAYERAKANRSERMKKYESEVLIKMRDAGFKVTKWVSEYALFSMVANVYSDALYQYSPSWLGNQSIDIFIPSLNVAIEYQGIQHFQPVEMFGGEEGYRATVLRDQRKAELCKQQHVKLIYFRYDEKVTKNMMLARIKNA